MHRNSMSSLLQGIIHINYAYFITVFSSVLVFWYISITSSVITAIHPEPQQSLVHDSDGNIFHVALFNHRWSPWSNNVEWEFTTRSLLSLIAFLLQTFSNTWGKQDKPKLCKIFQLFRVCQLTWPLLAYHCI